MWSLGHVPATGEDACLLTSDASLNPVVDGDIDVRSLVGGNLVIPSPRTVTFSYSNAKLNAAQGSTVHARGGTNSAFTNAVVTLNGSVYIGAGTNTAGLTVRNDAGSTTYLESDAPLTLQSPSFFGSLHLVNDTRLMSSDISVQESITGGIGASIRAARVSVGWDPLATRDLGVDLEIATLTPRGTVRVTGDITSTATLLDLRQSSTATLKLNGSTINGEDVRITSNVELTGNSVINASIRVQALSSTSFLRLTSCELNTPLIDASSTNATIEDLGCIDPPSGVVRTFRGNPERLQAILITSSGTFDGGGTLNLSGYFSLTPGISVVDAATVVKLGAARTTFDVVGPGTVDVDRIFSGYDSNCKAIQLRADDGEVLRLHSPGRANEVNLSCFPLAYSSGSGRIEIHDDQPFTNALVDVDVASDGAAPVRYFEGGVPVEPLRRSVELRDASWSPSVRAHVTLLTGHGTVSGPLSVEFLTPLNGDLVVLDDLIVQRLSGSFELGILDVTAATNHVIANVQLEVPIGTVLASGFEKLAVPGVSSGARTLTLSGGTLASGTQLELVPGTGVIRVAETATSPPPVSPTTTSPSPPPPLLSVPPPPPPTSITPTEVVEPTFPLGLRLFGSARGDVLLGRAGADMLFGRHGNDTIRGRAGNDTINGGPGNDRLFGDGGNDTISCGGGVRDVSFGGAGDDVIGCRDRGRGRDVIVCGPGHDRVIVDRADIVRNCEVVSRR